MSSKVHTRLLLPSCQLSASLSSSHAAESLLAAVRTPLLKAEMHFGASHAAAEPDRAALQAQHFNFPK